MFLIIRFMFSDPGKMELTTNLEHSNKSLWFCVCNCFMVLNWIKMGGHVGMYYDNLTLVHFTALYRQQATTSTDIDKYPWRQNLYDHLPYRTSPILIPWAFWQGYGSRLREQVARDHLGSRYLTIDAVEDSVPSNRKYGYTEAFTVSRWQGAVTEESLVPGPEQYGVSIVEVRWNSRGAMCQHIEAETKWTPFRRRHFEVHFLEWKCLNSDWDFIEVCS